MSIPDWLSKDHDEWAAKIDLQQSEEADLLVVVSGPVPIVTFLFSAHFCFLLQ